jgi:hypothetical protein
MFVFNNTTSKAISAAVLILGASIGYSIYTSGQNPPNLNVTTSQPDSSQTADNPIPSDLSGLLPTTTTDFIPDSLTGLVGQEVFSAFTKMDSNGTAIDNNTVDTVSKAFSDAMENNPLGTFTEYSNQDTNINTSPTAKDLQNFVDKINSIVDKYRIIFSSLANSGQDPSATPEDATFSLIAKSGAVYKNLASDLSLISVPEQTQEGFIDLLNSYSLSATALSEVKYYSKDPVRAGAGLKLHQQAAVLEIIAISELKKSLSPNGILFTLTPLSS